MSERNAGNLLFRRSKRTETYFSKTDEETIELRHRSFHRWNDDDIPTSLGECFQRGLKRLRNLTEFVQNNRILLFELVVINAARFGIAVFEFIRSENFALKSGFCVFADARHF